MDGPGIFARTLTAARVKDSLGNSWQYHPRSDMHSKAACWAVMYDLLHHSTLLQKHIEDGKVGFGINHEMHDWGLNRKKNLDLVICTPARDSRDYEFSFQDLESHYRIALTTEQQTSLRRLPLLEKRDVGSVLIALEAKACMTEHGKARPRLYDELAASERVVHGDSSSAIAAAFVAVNAAPSFASPTRPENRRSLVDEQPYTTAHDQPRVTIDVIRKIEQLRRRSSATDQGFDAIGLVVIECRNDGSPVDLVESSATGIPVPRVLQYEIMIDRMLRDYANRFNAL